ncbi:DapH/DapD/GlmU-related protein [Williamsia muralis]|uniref:DapH/DapD/GlmU-related protein n=1 Tax=Williamsia marianensis TaxID=85044 RepID=UPI0009FBD0F8|nr:DapH/DapD/GlmU-related protein [Williamsia muralis]
MTNNKPGTVYPRDLSSFTGFGYDKGRPWFVQVLWLFVSGVLFSRWWCPNGVRVWILRLFGAEIGERVVIRQNCRIHWPWKLSVGKNSWLGEGVYILNLEPVAIGSDVCVSQQAMLCTGSHDRRSPSFEFDNGPIEIGDGAWIATRAVVLRGVVVGAGAVVGAGVVVHKDVVRGGVVL